jgi:hypothetical protein
MISRGLWRCGNEQVALCHDVSAERGVSSARVPRGSVVSMCPQDTYQERIHGTTNVFDGLPATLPLRPPSRCGRPEDTRGQFESEGDVSEPIMCLSCYVLECHHIAHLRAISEQVNRDGVVSGMIKEPAKPMSLTQGGTMHDPRAPHFFDPDPLSYLPMREPLPPRIPDLCPDDTQRHKDGSIRPPLCRCEEECWTDEMDAAWRKEWREAT